VGSETRNRLGDDVGDTGLLLSVAAATAVRNINVELESIDLRARTFSILELVAHAGGMNQRRLADALRLNPSQIVALVDDLVAVGLVERRLDGTDRRSRLVCATDKGALRLTEARVLADRALDQTLRALDDGERATLHRLLSALIASGDPGS
jgi:DNA-binding MarR family transcriptional regulator